MSSVHEKPYYSESLNSTQVPLLNDLKGGTNVWVRVNGKPWCPARIMDREMPDWPTRYHSHFVHMNDGCVIVWLYGANNMM